MTTEIQLGAVMDYRPVYFGEEVRTLRFAEGLSVLGCPVQGCGGR